MEDASRPVCCSVGRNGRVCGRGGRKHKSIRSEDPRSMPATQSQMSDTQSIHRGGEEDSLRFELRCEAGMKPALPPIEVPGNTPMEKFDNLFRAVIAVPKSEIDKREKQWKRKQARKRAKKSA